MGRSAKNVLMSILNYMQYVSAKQWYFEVL